MIKRLLKHLFPARLRMRLLHGYTVCWKNTSRRRFAACGRHSQLIPPLTLDPGLVTLEDHTRLQEGIRLISSGGRLVVKKYSAISAGCTIVPGAHVPTVGLPQFLSITHINDKESTIVVEEDVWVGTCCLLLSHCRIGRGAVIGAGSTVTKAVPPYAVAVGSPCRIIATRFPIEQILRHEASLYPPEERMSREALEELFTTTYAGLRSIGTDQLSEEDKLALAKAKSAYEIPEYADR